MGMSTHKTILIVEDQKETRDMIAAVMKRDGFSVLHARTVREGKGILSRKKPDLILLDLVLPDGNGLEICAFVRSSENTIKTPIIALTGLTELDNKKLGFAAGVDQYLEKPIVIDELSLWVNALLRRVNWDESSATPQTFGDLRICPDSYIVAFKKQIIGNLTSREFELFHFLVRTSPKIASRQKIIAEVWKTVSVENLVDTHIFNLRQKLPHRLAERVQSIPGKGFRYLRTNYGRTVP